MPLKIGDFVETPDGRIGYIDEFREETLCKVCCWTGKCYIYVTNTLTRIEVPS